MAVEITRAMIPAWQNALVGRWDYEGTGNGVRSISRGAAHVDHLVADAAARYEAEPDLVSIGYERSDLVAALGNEEDAEDCWRALVTLRGEAGQHYRLAQRAGCC